MSLSSIKGWAQPCASNSTKLSATNIFNIKTIMEKLSIEKLAIMGCQLERIADNVANLKLEVWQLNRLVNGLPCINQDKLIAKLQETNKTFIRYTWRNGLSDQACLCVHCTTTENLYFTEQVVPEGAILSGDEARKLRSKHNYSYSKDDAYPCKVSYVSETYDYFVPEEFED